MRSQIPSVTVANSLKYLALLGGQVKYVSNWQGSELVDMRCVYTHSKSELKDQLLNVSNFQLIHQLYMSSEHL